MKYISRKDIKSATIKHNGGKLVLSPNEFLNGAYTLKKGGDLSQYKYIPKRNVVSIETKNGKIKDNLNGLYVKRSALSKKKPKSLKSAKISSLKSPSEMIDVDAYPEFKNLIGHLEIAVELYKEKRPTKDVRLYLDFVDIEAQNILRDFPDNEDYIANLAYVILWTNYNLPKRYSLTNIVSDGVSEDIRKILVKELNSLPYKQKKIARIKDKDILKSTKIHRLLDNFGSRDDLRPQLMLSKVDDGFLVTTNAHILLAIYSDKLEGKDELLPLTKAAKKSFKSSKTSLKYPQWKSVIPQVSNSLKINGSELYNKLKKIYDYELYNSETASVGLKVGDVDFVFNISFLLICLRSMIALKGDKLYIHYSQANNRAIVINASERFSVLEKESLAITMPIVNYTKNIANVDANTNKIFKKGGYLK